MGTGPNCNYATQSILIICVISIFIFHSNCSNTEQITCEPAVCQHGICYRTTKSTTVGGEIRSSTKQCPRGFDKFQNFCFKLGRVKDNWSTANSYSENNGRLVTLFGKEDVNTAAEYLWYKVTVDYAPVWINLVFDNISALHNNQPLCTALEPTNYTYWKTRDCESKLYSLRTHNLSNPTPTFDIMCRCHPGYTGKSCDTNVSKLSTRDLTNTSMLPCSRNTVIFIEFTLDGYRVRDTTELDSFVTNRLAIMRAECQGKRNCDTKFSNESYIYNHKSQQATLVFRHSCVNANDMYCPSGAFRIEDDKRVSCILPTNHNVVWYVAFHYCFQRGAYLASFNKGMDRVNFSAIARRLKPLSAFWTSDDLSDNRSRNTWAMAITNHQYNGQYASVPVENTNLLPGICVSPPLYRARTIKVTTAMTTVHTTAHTAVHNNGPCPTTTSIKTKMGNTSNTMTLNDITIIGSTICLTAWMLHFRMN